MWDPTKRSKDILLQAKGGSPGSGPLRSDGSRDDQAGEAGPVEQKLSRGPESQTKGQGTVRLLPQWATTEAARWEAREPNKELLS